MLYVCSQIHEHMLSYIMTTIMNEMRERERERERESHGKII